MGDHNKYAVFYGFKIFKCFFLALKTNTKTKYLQGEEAPLSQISFKIIKSPRKNFAVPNEFTFPSPALPIVDRIVSSQEAFYKPWSTCIYLNRAPNFFYFLGNLGAIDSPVICRSASMKPLNICLYYWMSSLPGWQYQ